MKIPSFRIGDTNDSNKAKTDKKQFACKQCKMTFQSKDTLALHKKRLGIMADWYILEEVKDDNNNNNQHSSADIAAVYSCYSRIRKID